MRAWSSSALISASAGLMYFTRADQLTIFFASHGLRSQASLHSRPRMTATRMFIRWRFRGRPECSGCGLAGGQGGGAAFAEDFACPVGAFAGEGVVPAARFAGFGRGVVPEAFDPAHVLEPVEYAVDGRPGPLGGADERAAVQAAGLGDERGQ